MKKLLGMLMAVGVLFAACSTTAVDSGDSLLVSTKSGKVQGVEKENVRVWYGIPYGKEPVGSLRWQPPVSPDSWTEPLDCTTAPACAIQLSGTDIIGSDDSLRLTVYAPENAASKNLPVLVYIHGGNNQTGTSEEIVGFDIVKNVDCIYVSVDYRLGLLGFNCLPSLVKEKGATGNFAMLDIASALDWVKDNIKNFGGNPKNVTISGFSAGGRDVMAMLISPVFKDKFQKAVVFSGGMTTADVELSVNKIARAIAPLAVEDGAAQDEESAYQWLLTDGDDVKDYLYSVSSARLASLIGNAGIRMSVFPHLYEDDVVIPKGGFDNANYNNVPLMMVTGSTEFSFFCLFDGFFFSPAAQVLGEDSLNAAKSFANKYGSDMYRIFNAQESARSMQDYKSPIYICQVDFGSENSASSNALLPFGAFHGIFVPMLAKQNGYVGLSNGAFEQEGYKAMSRAFCAYLSNFLRAGNPNADELTEWPVWSNTELSLVLDASETEAFVSAKNVTTTYEEIMDKMDSDDSVESEAKTLVIENVMNGRWFSSALDKRYNTKNLWD